MTRRRRVYVNEAFRPQRVSGQQRYAGEIAARLPDDVVHVAPTGVWARSKLATWLWVQTILPLRTWRGVLISMTARAPIWHPRHVVVVHDLFVIEHPEWFSKLYHLTHAPLQRFQMATGSAILSVSEPVAAQIREHYGVRVDVAPNAPSPVFAAPAATAAAATAATAGDEAAVTSRGLTPGDYLVTVGSLEPRKNLARLAEAYGRLDADTRRSMPLVIVGGSASLFSEHRVEWPDGTILAGYVSDDELRALYAASRATVFVSLAEGFGLPIVEAAMAGSPRLVLSDLDVFRWIAHDRAIYAAPDSVDDIERALREIPNAPVNDLSDVSERFTWEDSAATVYDAALRAADRRNA